MHDLVIQRAQLLKQLRGFFDDRGFYEVQPPCLSRDCVVDAYLDPITVRTEKLRLSDLDLPEQFFLQTSPESTMKRMLVAGAPSIYSIGPVFRSGEAGDHHNVEFTMLEWYHLGASVDEEIELLGKLACGILDRPSHRVVRYRDVFLDHLQFDPITAPLQQLQRRLSVEDESLAKTLGDDRDAVLDALLSIVIQPTFIGTTPWILRDYPLSQAALARKCPNDPECASRFELFVDGIECANGYDELLDADELVRRANRNNEVRRKTGREVLPVDTTLTRAMRKGLPPCCGVALGVDRLMMLSVRADHIGQVIPFRIEDA